jgi:hypothetical protein
LVAAGRAGDLAVGVSVAPIDGRSARARAIVIGAEGPRPGLVVSFRVAGRAHRASSCGRGCYEAVVRLASNQPKLAVAVTVPGRAQQIAQLPMPAAWPAPPATPILRRAESAWRRLRSLDAVSRIASDARHSVTTAWRFGAPNRLAYRNLPGGAEAVVIGGRRWDRASSRSRWQESAQDAVRQPVPPWSGATAFAHLLATETIDGRKVLRISFLDRSAPAWFTILVDAATYRTTRVDMVAQAHFMHQANRDFDRGAAIKAPRGQLH